MQKIVYLLQIMGIALGDYNFHWYVSDQGVSSLVLSKDILSIDQSDITFVPKYSDDAEDTFRILRDIISLGINKYNETEWLDCLASLHYFKNNMIAFDASDEQIIEQFMKRKSSLNNKTMVKEALEQVHKL